MGTPEFAVPSLNLLAKHHEVIAVYSQPPRANGRGMTVKKTPIHNLAKNLSIPTFIPSSLKKDDTRSTFQNLKPDIVVVVAYGLILPSSYLEIPKYGCINGHASLLPRWRGAAPIQRAIEAGDKETGTCIMVMEKGMDTGPIILSNKIIINEDENAQTLYDKLSILTAKSLIVAIKMYVEEKFVPKKQDELGIMYASKIEKNDSILIIDDLIATGGTAEAAAKLIEMSGGNIAAFIFAINLFDLGGCNNLIKKGYHVDNIMDIPGN